MGAHASDGFVDQLLAEPETNIGVSTIISWIDALLPSPASESRFQRGHYE